MLCSAGRVLIRRNLSLKRQFSCVLRQTHFESLRNSSLFPPSISELPPGSSSSSSFSVFRRHAALGLVLSYLRPFRSMASESQNTKSVHDFTVKDAKGNDVDLSVYKGKVLLIVNVASKCSFTNSNYMELGELYNKYKNQGLEILAFPCNQFGSQEPGTNEQIVEFAYSHFKAEYPIFDKVDVNGGNATPLYKFLKSSKGGLFGDSIKWNFTKFLVDKEGNVIDRYASTTSPLIIEVTLAYVSRNLLNDAQS